MVRKKKEELEEEKGVKEEEGKDEKKNKREESANKRRNAKKKDKAARWSGAILFAVLLFVGFLMWVVGEIKTEKPVGGRAVPRETAAPSIPFQQGKVLVE